MEPNLINNVLGYEHQLNPNMYEAFRAFNPKLTKKMYQYLRGNSSEWKILCGIGVKIKYDTETLDPIWSLRYINGDIYEHRYVPSYYLDTNNWNYGSER
jgi:hypothetical protein